MKRFEMSKKQHFRETRDSPREYKYLSRDKDAFFASIHPQDPFRVSPHKRSRSSAVDQHTILIHERNSLLEIPSVSLRDKSYIPHAGDSPSKDIDQGRGKECSNPMDAHKATLNKVTYHKKWHSRQKSDSGPWDQPGITINISKSIPREKCRGSSPTSNRWRHGKDEIIRRREKGSSPHDERSEVTRNSKLLWNFSESKPENVQRFDTWSLACALAYDYVNNNRYAIESKGWPVLTSAGHSVKKMVQQQQERGKTTQKIDGPATKGEASQVLCIEGRKGDAIGGVQVTGTKDKHFRALWRERHQEEAM